MRGVRAFGALVGVAALMAAGVAALPAGAADPPPQADRGLVDARVCGPPAAGSARCHAHVLARPDGHGGVTPDATSGPSGLSPAEVKEAYGFSTSLSAGSGKTIAIVDAYDAPHIESDLAKFSQQFGIPCNGCFTKVDQNGGSSYPRRDSGWALEIALDVEWAHAIAPGANILLVEASSNSFADLMVAEDYAAAHADYVSNSWGASEFSSEAAYDPHFAANGVSFFVSAGDNGTPAEYPSSSPKVISVGGTTLHYSGTTLTGETGWSDGGGGCSVYESATSAQSGFGGYDQANCAGKRATPDVSLVADPASGVSVYSSDYSRTAGWYVVGGTSASAPMWAARSAVEGKVVDSGYVYGNSIPFRDITDGNNGASCLVGFDLCTGQGSWADNGAIPTSGSTTTTTTAGGSTTSTTAGSSATTVAATAITYAVKGKNLQITVTVRDNLGHAVGGASVSVTVLRNGTSIGTATGTTSSSGTVAFVVRGASTGTYTTHIDDITASGLTWDSKTPSNSTTI